jgi:uncharacterized protein YjiS (DUF1127 family)
VQRECRYEGTHALRSFTLGEIIVEIIVAAMRAAGAIARRAHARHLHRRQARAIYDALRYLDDRTLRNLGFERSEIKSVAARVMEEARTPACLPY